MDTSFEATPFTLRSELYPTAVQTDGKIVVGGDFISRGGFSRLNICHYNLDDTFDTSFSSLSAGTNAGVNIAIIRIRGEILIGGFFSTYKGAVRRHLAQIVPGETIICNGSSNTNWNDTANWTSAQVPTISDAVVIPTGVLPFKPMLNASMSAMSATNNTNFRRSQSTSSTNQPAWILLTQIRTANFSKRLRINSTEE